MARRKILSDSDVLAIARQLFHAGGDKALSFGALSRATGLAASTLAQRFATIEGLQIAAACDGWQQLSARIALADEASAGKGPAGFLKAMEDAPAEATRLLRLGGSDAQAATAANGWRIAVETGLLLRLGQGDKARSAARAIFAAWQGQALWGGLDLKIKDLAKRLI